MVYDAKSTSKYSVILNDVKNLNALSGCNQILRVAQDDTMIGKFNMTQHLPIIIADRPQPAASLPVQSHFADNRH